MVLKCAGCGNTQIFSIFLEQCLAVEIEAGQIKVCPGDIREAQYLPFAAVVCDCCLSRDVKKVEDFRERFWAAYEKQTPGK